MQAILIILISKGKSESSLRIMVLLWVYFLEEAIDFTRGRALCVMVIWAILGKRVFSGLDKSTCRHIPENFGNVGFAESIFFEKIKHSGLLGKRVSLYRFI